MFCRALHTLLVNEVNVTQRGLFVGEKFRTRYLQSETCTQQRPRYPANQGFSGPVLFEFGVAQLGCRLAVLRR